MPWHWGNLRDVCGKNNKKRTTSIKKVQEKAMLELINVSYETPDGKEIIKGVDLVIDDRFVAITGPNGSGKSTLAKLDRKSVV